MAKYLDGDDLRNTLGKINLKQMGLGQLVDYMAILRSVKTSLVLCKSLGANFTPDDESYISQLYVELERAVRELNRREKNYRNE